MKLSILLNIFLYFLILLVFKSYFILAELKISAPFFSYDENNRETNQSLNAEDVEKLSQSPFIVGGKDANEGEFPWQISLQKDTGTKTYHFCGGSIIDKTHVICASHCTIGQDASRIYVVAGAHNMKDSNESSQQRRKVKRLIQNPKYNPRTINFDSSIIEVEEPFIFNDRVKPIRLPPKGHDPSGKCVSSGWGNANRLGIRPVVIPNTLQKVNMTVVPRGVCRISYLFFVRAWLTTNMVCGGASPFKGSCNGDSGGPLVCYDLPNDPEPYIAGITSFGVPPCGQMIFPSVFANVASMRDFIDEHIEPPGSNEMETNTDNVTESVTVSDEENTTVNGTGVTGIEYPILQVTPSGVNREKDTQTEMPNIPTTTNETTIIDYLVD